MLYSIVPRRVASSHSNLCTSTLVISCSQPRGAVRGGGALSPCSLLLSPRGPSSSVGSMAGSPNTFSIFKEQSGFSMASDVPCATESAPFAGGVAANESFARTYYGHSYPARFPFSSSSSASMEDPQPFEIFSDCPSCAVHRRV